MLASHIQNRKIHVETLYFGFNKHWSLSQRVWYFQESQQTIIYSSYSTTLTRLPCNTLTLFFFHSYQILRTDLVFGDTRIRILVAYVSLRDYLSCFHRLLFHTNGYTLDSYSRKKRKPIVEIWQSALQS